MLRIESSDDAVDLDHAGILAAQCCKSITTYDGVEDKYGGTGLGLTMCQGSGASGRDTGEPSRPILTTGEPLPVVARM